MAKVTESEVDIEEMYPRTGRLVKEDGTFANEADLLEAILVASGGGSTGADIDSTAEVLVVTPTTPVQVTAVATVKTLLIKALPGNAGDVYYGLSGVTAANGQIVEPGEPVILTITDPSTLYIDADNANDGIRVMILG